MSTPRIDIQNITNMAIGTGPGEDPTSALRSVLGPLIEWAVSQSVSHGEFDELVRELYVAAARKAGADTISAFHVHTGLHRRDIGRLLEKATNTDLEPRRELRSIPSLVLHAWTGPGRLDKRGKPKPLPRLRSQGGESSFEALVQSVSLEVRPRSLLDMWLSLKMVELDANDRVHLRYFDFDRPSIANPVPQAERVVVSLGAYTRAVFGNIMGQHSIPCLAVQSMALSAESAMQLHKQWVPKVFALLQKINVAVTAAEAADAKQGRVRDHSLQLGSYFVTDPLLPSMRVGETQMP